jgi:hypothetical protein
LKKEIKKEIKIHNIDLNIKIFENSPTNFFITLNNREPNHHKSGLLNIYEILVNEYQNLQGHISTNLKHKVVYDLIVKLSKKMNKLTEIDEKYMFLQVSQLKKSLESYEKHICTQASQELNSLLTDLHKLGVIIYFDNEILGDIIITNPKWFNVVFKEIIDYGRKRIQSIFQFVFDVLEEYEENGNYPFYRQKDNCKKCLEIILKDLKKNVDPNLKIEQIWDNVKEQSIVDKVSYHSLLEKLDVIQQKLNEEKFEHILNEFKDKDEFHYDITQSIHSIKSSTLHSIMEEILNIHAKDKVKKSFLKNLLIKFDLILPKKKIEFLKNNQLYLVPFLFPNEKPHKTIFLKGSTKIENFERDFEWKIDYHLVCLFLLIVYV